MALTNKQLCYSISNGHLLILTIWRETNITTR